MPFANYKFPAGTLTSEQKEEIIHKTTDLFASYFGEGVRPTRWCSSMTSQMAAGVGPTRHSRSPRWVSRHRLPAARHAVPSPWPPLVDTR